jgi:hypothetical protein
MSEHYDMPQNDLLPEYISALETRIERLESELSDIKSIMIKHERVIRRFQNNIPRLPQTNVVSEDFLPRAFAIWGHYLVANFIIAIPLICIVAILN